MNFLRIRQLYSQARLNIRAYIKKIDTRIDRIEDGVAYIKEGPLHLAVYPWHRARLYRNSAKYRGAHLGRVYMLDHINFKDGDIFIDCGANVGDLKLYFYGKRINIEYIGIEPAPKEFICLRNNIKPSLAINCALSNENKKMTFYISSDGADSSLIKPANPSTTTSVEAKRLDSIIEEARVIKLLKIEAEGAEPEVILGATATLRNTEYVVVDAGPERGPKQENTLAEVTDILYSHGFKMIRFNHRRFTALFQRK